jgi:hypothetical protein
MTTARAWAAAAALHALIIIAAAIAQLITG